MSSSGRHPIRILDNPRWVTALFSSTDFAWLWLMARVYVGWHWVDAGWHKVTSDSWMGGGATLKGFWERAVAVPEGGRPAIVYDWYREFLQFLLNAEAYTWFAKLISVGELLVGIALLAGILTGIAALFGAFMNWNFMLAGSASTNPVMGLLGIALLVAWKTAGWWGLDRVVLSYVGAPWLPGPLFGGLRAAPPGQGAQSRRHLIEQWTRILIGVGLALFALIALSGPWQVVILLLAGALVALTGLGLFPLVRPPQRDATP